MTVRYIHQQNMGRISIHTLRVDGDIDTFGVLPQIHISIHTLRVEGDEYLWADVFPGVFQSTPSAWRVTTYRRFTVK